MNYGTMSPITKLRSNVQWYLDGNTPGPETAPFVELYASLKALNTHLVTIDKTDQKLKSLSEKPQRDLANLDSLKETQECLLRLVTSGEHDKNAPAFALLRECTIQLILVAEGRQEPAFREGVLALAKSI